MTPRERIAALAAEQHGTISRPQVLLAGLSDKWLARQLAAARWQRVHPGVYAVVTGPLTWPARCWAALLYGGTGAVLAGDSAVRAWHEPTSWPGGPITVAIDHTRRVRATRGVRVVRVKGLSGLVHPTRRPPSLRLEHAVLLGAAAGRRDKAIGLLADACQQHRTTPDRLLWALGDLPGNLRHRRLIRDFLDDVLTGAYSYLEVRYLRGVEVAHALPTGTRQRRAHQGRRIWYVDVEYSDFALMVELDGRLGHETFQDRARDMERDNATAIRGGATLRLGYAQVVTAPCATAAVVAAVLTRRGWTARPRPCGSHCRAADEGAGETSTP